MSQFFVKLMLIFTLLAVVVPCSYACSQSPGFGFILLAQVKDESPPFPMFINQPDIDVGGNFTACSGSCSGSTSGFSGTTNSSGELSELGKATPAFWDIQFFNGGPRNPPCLASGEALLQPSSSPQGVFCIIDTDDSVTSSPSSFDNSTGTTQFTVTMTDNSEAWPRTPYSYTVFDASGNLLSTGTVTVSDSYDCYATMTLDAQNSATQYIWVADANGYGMGYATISVTDGTGGGGG